MANKSKSKKAPKSSSKKSSKKKAPARSASKAKKAPPKPVAPKKPSGPPFPIKTPAKFLRPLEENIKPAKPPKFSAAFMEKQKSKLAELRDHIVDQMQGVTKDSLRERGEGGCGSVASGHDVSEVVGACGATP